MSLSSETNWLKMRFRLWIKWKLILKWSVYERYQGKVQVSYSADFTFVFRHYEESIQKHSFEKSSNGNRCHKYNHSRHSVFSVVPKKKFENWTDLSLSTISDLFRIKEKYNKTVDYFSIPRCPCESFSEKLEYESFSTHFKDVEWQTFFMEILKFFILWVSISLVS